MRIGHPLRISVCLLFLVVSCADKQEKPATSSAMPPDSLISPARMVHILTDVHLIEAALLLERNEGLEPEDKPAFFYDGIFKKYNISRSRYDANMKYYADHPDEMTKIYDKVIQQIEARQKKFPPRK